MRRCLVVLVVWSACASALEAQHERYELGRRLRAFENAWEAEASPAKRKAAVPRLQGAVTNFFSLRLRDAGKAMDESRFVLEAAEPTAARRSARSLFLRLDARFVDEEFPRTKARLERFYEVDSAGDAKGELIVTRVGAAPPVVVHNAAITSLPMELSLNLANLGPGDHLLQTAVKFDGQEETGLPQLVSVAPQLAKRLAALKDAVDARGASANTTDAATLAANVRLLQSLVDQKPLETDYPAARILEETEALAAALNAEKPFHDATKTGQRWMTLAPGRSTVAIRLAVPGNLPAGKRVPLVIALHGAGGSENLFFDGYGNGKAVRLAAERDWIIVAPRLGFGTGALTQLIDELARIYPVDVNKVFVVGHSMGAAQAVAAVGQAPERFAAVAALGGGGNVRSSEGIKRVPFFVGVGTEDFALQGARALRANLEKNGVKATYKEYADVEHLVIVQEALKDVYAFFDEHAKP